MPAHDKKPAEENKPLGLTHPFVAPDEEAKPEPKAKAAPEKPAAKAAKHDEPGAPAPERRTIEELLADPSFDPDGKVRARLAEISAHDGMDQHPPADLVDDHGQPVG